MPELLVSAPRKWSGELWVLDPVQDSVHRRHSANLTHEEFQRRREDGLPPLYRALAVAPLGDVNGDGVADVAVGESSDSCASCVGSVAVFSGVDGERLYVVLSAETRRAALREGD